MVVKMAKIKKAKNKNRLSSSTTTSKRKGKMKSKNMVLSSRKGNKDAFVSSVDAALRGDNKAKSNSRTHFQVRRRFRSLC